MTSLGYYPDWEDDWSGYTPPNSDLTRHGDTLDGLPAPTYIDDIDHSLGTQWAQILIGLAIDRYGGGNEWWADSPFTKRCDCGVTWIGDGPCWNCHPQPAPRLIVPGCRDRALP